VATKQLNVDDSDAQEDENVWDLCKELEELGGGI